MLDGCVVLYAIYLVRGHVPLFRRGYNLLGKLELFACGNMMKIREGSRLLITLSGAD
jgi:hypothetical protein